jgi:hypothetical protein
VETANNFYTSACVEAVKQIKQGIYDITCADNKDLYELYNCGLLNSNHGCNVDKCYKCPKVAPCEPIPFLTFNCDLSLLFTNLIGNCNLLQITIE